MKITPFLIASEGVQYLKISLTKEVQDLCSEKYKTLLKELKGNPNKYADMAYSRIGKSKLNIIKITILSLVYTLNVIPSKILAGLSVEIDKLILKVIWKCQGSKIVKTVFLQEKLSQCTHTT